MTFRWWASAETASSTRYRCPVKGCPRETLVLGAVIPECPGHGRQMVPAARRREG